MSKIFTIKTDAARRIFKPETFSFTLTGIFGPMEEKKQRIHFIAIAGSVMHNLAIALRQAGHEVTGSDDEIFEPARGALSKNSLLPAKEGWYPEKITPALDVVMLGMHARKDNPELLRAQELGLKIHSFPDYVYERSQDSQRIVIAGSHGKTTITAMIIHVLSALNRKFDYVIGARVRGIAQTVRLTDAPVIIIEGDEYLSSALDPTPKFLRYQHHIGLISGIAWDHANVFPSEEDYVKQFDLFADQTPKGGTLIYCDQDSMALIIGKKERVDVTAVSYKSHPHAPDTQGGFALTYNREKYPIRIFGSHNFQNLSGAREVLKKIGVTNEQFYHAIRTFEGAAGRLEVIGGKPGSVTIYKDFAHAPSKVTATVKAVREIYPSRELVACVELHTYSSLNKKFLPQYKGTLKNAQVPVVYFNPENVKAKRLEPLSASDIRAAFANPRLEVFDQPEKLESFLMKQPWENRNLLMMSSGNFGGLDLATLSTKILAG